MMRTTMERTGVLYEVLNPQGVVIWGRFERFAGRQSMTRRVQAAREQERVAMEKLGYPDSINEVLVLKEGWL